MEAGVGDDVGDVADVFFSLSHFDENRIVVKSLSGQDVPVVETGGVAFEMPLSDHGGLVTCLLEEFGEGLLRAVEVDPVVDDAVDMAVFSSEDDGPAGSADRVGAEAVVKSHAPLGDAIEVGRFVDFAAVATHGVRGVVVGHDEDDVWFFG